MTTLTRQSSPSLSGASKSIGVPLMRWIAGAWRHLNWRHVLLAMVLAFVATAFGPYGGAWLNVGTRGPDDPWLEVLSGRWLVQTLPIVFAAMVADEACDTGVGPFVAYGSAMALCAIVLPALDPFFARMIAMGSIGRRFNNFLCVQILLEGGSFMAAWGYWHVARRATGLVQAAEAERVRDQRRLLNARLLTLQARVEPQFLFDALSKVREAHERDPFFADALLADMISLLRAMLPTTTRATSTVEREFGLARAWGRVKSQLGENVELTIASPDDAANSALAPMLVLPMLRAVIEGPMAARGPWQLAAQIAATSGDNAGVESRQRLRISLMSAAGRSQGSTTNAITSATTDATTDDSSPDIAALRERVMQLYESGATIAWAQVVDRSVLILDVPMTIGDAQ